jgi:hypothetical protein
MCRSSSVDLITVESDPLANENAVTSSEDQRPEWSRSAKRDVPMEDRKGVVGQAIFDPTKRLGGWEDGRAHQATPGAIAPGSEDVASGSEATYRSAAFVSSEPRPGRVEGIARVSDCPASSPGTRGRSCAAVSDRYLPRELRDWFAATSPSALDRAGIAMRPLPLCDECGRRIEARRRWAFSDTLCRRCYVKVWVRTILEALPF